MAADSEGTPEGRRSRRGARALAALLGLLALYATLVLAADSPPARRALRGWVERALARALPGARLEGEVRVDARLRVTFGPLIVPAQDPGAPPALRVERVAVSPRRLALLAGRAEPGVVRLWDVRLEAGPRGEELRALSERLRGGRRSAAPAPEGRPAPPDVRFDGLRIALGGRVAGPVSGVVLPGEPTELWLRVPGGGRVEATLHRQGAGELELSARASGIVLSDPAIAPEPVGPIRLALRGRIRADPEGRRLSLEDGRLELGRGVVLSLRVAAAGGDEPRAELLVQGERVDWEALLAALPATLRPAPELGRIGGTVSFRFQANGPAARPADWRLDGSLDLGGLRPLGTPRLALPFDHRTPAFAGDERTVRVGPENPQFVRLDELPRHVVAAVTLAEDAGFFAHRGFDLAEIREALAERAQAGRVRGASTITQQLAKNLLRDDERSLARKAREALATVVLEASLPKRRLLEIYLNVIEWGPGIFGLGEASAHYFARRPADLTAKEAAFLASILPSPVRYHGYYSRGALSEVWEERVRALLAKLRAAEAIDAAQLDDAVRAPLAFARPGAVTRAPLPPEAVEEEIPAPTDP